jgi:hypothetical protein
MGFGSGLLPELLVSVDSGPRNQHLLKHAIRSTKTTRPGGRLAFLSHAEVPSAHHAALAFQVNFRVDHAATIIGANVEVGLIRCLPVRG